MEQVKRVEMRVDGDQILCLNVNRLWEVNSIILYMCVIFFHF